MKKKLSTTLDDDLRLLVEVRKDVNDELGRQRDKWGVQRHDNGRWLAILVEEVGESAQAMQEGSEAYKESDADDLYKEIVQVAAVAESWAAQVLELRRKNIGRKG